MKTAKEVANQLRTISLVPYPLSIMNESFEYLYLWKENHDFFTSYKGYFTTSVLTLEELKICYNFFEKFADKEKYYRGFSAKEWIENIQMWVNDRFPELNDPFFDDYFIELQAFPFVQDGYFPKLLNEKEMDFFLYVSLLNVLWRCTGDEKYMIQIAGN